MRKAATRGVHPHANCGKFASFRFASLVDKNGGTYVLIGTFRALRSRRMMSHWQVRPITTCRFVTFPENRAAAGLAFRWYLFLTTRGLPNGKARL